MTEMRFRTICRAASALVCFMVAIGGNPANALRTDCDFRCANIQNILCGNNGKTYQNFCFLHQDSCIRGQPFKVAHVGECKEAVPCFAACPKLLDPVCGKDGVTYANMCELRACEAHTPPAVAHQGECGSASTCKVSFYCTNTSPPVCGKNGTTYPNICALQDDYCSKGQEWELAHDGECVTPDQCNAVVCARDLKPVCGTDGKTYIGDCDLKTSQCKTGQPAAVAHSGECVTPDQCETDCPDDLQPVCGRDNNTYGNMCLLELSYCKVGRPARLLHQGKCGSHTGGSCTFRCPSYQEPVCGKNGTTYHNMCFMRQAFCEGGPGVKLDYYGGCGFPLMDGHHYQCYMLDCDSDSGTVCGKNGRTYPNFCALQMDYCMKGAGAEAAVHKYEACTTQCNYSCPNDNDPVCSTNGKTHRNRCELEKEACIKGDNSVSMHRGPCMLFVDGI